MNLQYLKYAVEVAACGSINKVAEKLYIGQPNLSRAIKELEASLGVSIFDRSSKGMEITPDGEIFLQYAKAILKQVEEAENIFRKNGVHKKRFSISVPRASYISEAFANFSKEICKVDAVEIFYKETNSLRAIKNILEADYKLGIIRYAENYDKYYKDMLDEKCLNYELLNEFRYVLLMSAESPLAALSCVTLEDLQEHSILKLPTPTRSSRRFRSRT